MLKIIEYNQQSTSSKCLTVLSVLVPLNKKHGHPSILPLKGKKYGYWRNHKFPINQMFSKISKSEDENHFKEIKTENVL